MEIADHAALSRTYITASVWLEEMGIHQLAAEAVWGAANLAVEAARHARGRRHGNARDKERFVIDLDAAGAGPLGFAGGFDIVQGELHNHFYTNQLSAAEASRFLVLGRTFVAQMLAIAELPNRRISAS